MRIRSTVVRPRLRLAAGMVAMVCLLAVLTVSVSRAAFSGSTANSSNNVTVVPPDYTAQVFRSGPVRYWRLDEASGNFRDFTGNNTTLPTTNAGVGFGTAISTASQSLSYAQSGGVSGDNAVSFSNDCTGETSSSMYLREVSVEVWFKTTTSTGGSMVTADTSSGTTAAGSAEGDTIYMDNSGYVYWGVRNASSSLITIKSGSTYRDGNWHMAVGTIGTSGMVLYIDGASVGSNAENNPPAGGAYWHIGCGRAASWTGTPTNSNITATLDDVAVFNRALSASEVSGHYNAAAVSSTLHAYAAAVVADSPATYQRFNEYAITSQGIDVMTANTSGKDGSAFNGVTTTAGAIAGDMGNAFKFDGSSGCSYWPTSVANPQTFSLELWFKTASGYGTGGVLAQLNSDAGYSSTTPTSYGRAVYMTNAGKLIFATTSSSGTAASSASYNDGNWHHVVATLSGGTAANLYVDGVSVASATLTAPANFTGYWHVGCGRLTSFPSVPTTAYFMAVSIDEFATYTSAISSGTASTHYQSGGLSERGFAARLALDNSAYEWWRFGESSGAPADSSGNGRGATLSAGDKTQNVSGVFAGNSLSPTNAAITFGGTSGCAVGTTNIGSFPTNFSISLWFKTNTANGGPLMQLNDRSAASTNGSETYGASVSLKNDGTIGFYVNGGGSIGSASGYNDNVWHRVVATMGLNGMRLWVDGVTVSTSTSSSSGTSATAYDHIGCGRTIDIGITNSYFVGTIDEFMRVNSTVSDAWITDTTASANW